MTKIQIMSFLDTISKTGAKRSLGQEFGKKLKDLITPGTLKDKIINQGNWGYSETPMPTEYSYSSDVAPM